MTELNVIETKPPSLLAVTLSVTLAVIISSGYAIGLAYLVSHSELICNLVK